MSLPPRQDYPLLFRKRDLYILESASPVGTTQKMAQLIFVNDKGVRRSDLYRLLSERILPLYSVRTQTQ